MPQCRTARNGPRRSSDPATRFRPTLEALEERTVPTVVYNGGPLLPAVEVQALYYGSDWATSTYQPQTTQTDNFLSFIVNSSYMDMLTNAGYNVGRGSEDPGAIVATSLNKSKTLSDSTIRNVIQAQIDNGTLKNPDSNRLYIMYVEDGVVVRQGLGTSHTLFLGYHNYFKGTDAQGNPMNIYYAVIPYQAGRNAHEKGLSEFDSSTEVTSHELAEAVTDPVPGTGWYDNKRGEIGDITNGQGVRLNGYAVQKVANQQDQPIAPAGSTPLTVTASGATAADQAPAPLLVHLVDPGEGVWVGAVDALFSAGW
jgi:hypothetical protein